MSHEKTTIFRCDHPDCDNTAPEPMRPDDWVTLGQELR